MHSKKAAAAAALAIGMAGFGAQAQMERVEAGTLACRVQPSVGLLLGSVKDMACTYRVADGRVGAYVGRITRVGVDIGITGEQVILWQVFAPTVDLPPGALAGDYVGASAQATAGIGAGANVLVGGSNATISLQPVSISAQTGVNLAAGVAGLELRPAVVVR